MNRPGAISSWSGGKDSCLAYYRAMRQGRNVSCLLNFVSKGTGRGCFHGIDNSLMRRQADSLGARLIQKEVSPDMENYETEFKAAVRELMAEGADSMVFGDIYLLDHAGWVERVCGELGITPVEPLWNMQPRAIMEEFLGLGFKAVIVSCQADKLGKEFVGRYLDSDIVNEFERLGVCPCGENGEYHTLVVDGPIFKDKIEILESEPLLKEGFWKHWFLDIRRFK
jgi:uncharacterized protein (TIGR00290 family)